MISKISISNIVFNFLDMEPGDKNSSKFDHFLRIAYRGAGRIASYDSLSHINGSSVIKNNKANIKPYVIVEDVTVDGIQAFYSGSEETVLSPKVEPTSNHEPVYDIQNNMITFKWRKDQDLDGKTVNYRISVFETDHEGVIMVPANWEEAIITFIRAEDAYEVMKKSGGRQGVSMYNSMISRADRMIIEAQSEDNTISPNKFRSIMRMWSSKVPSFYKK